MSISQVDMVVWGGPTSNSDRPPRETVHPLQVCGDLLIAGEGDADPQSFTAVIRQGDNVATLHAAAPFNRETFKFEKDGRRWELKGNPEPEVRFATQELAVVSAVIILKREPAGLETLSWVQPVMIESERLKPAQPLKFHPEVVAQLTLEKAQEPGDSVLSSLAIQPDPDHPDTDHPDTFSTLQRIDKVPKAPDATP